jgi:hypothetical protein
MIGKSLEAQVEIVIPSEAGQLNRLLKTYGDFYLDVADGR